MVSFAVEQSCGFLMTWNSSPDRITFGLLASKDRTSQSCHTTNEIIVLLAFSNRTFNSGKIRLLENLVMTWKSQIQAAIDYDRDPSPRNQLYPLPTVEIDFWTTRAENLRGIQRQVGPWWNFNSPESRISRSIRHWFVVWWKCLNCPDRPISLDFVLFSEMSSKHSMKHRTWLSISNRWSHSLTRWTKCKRSSRSPHISIDCFTPWHWLGRTRSTTPMHFALSAFSNNGRISSLPK